MTKTLSSLFFCASLIVALPTISASDQASDSATIDLPMPDTAPRPLKTKPPRYPSKLREQGVSGAVILTVIIEDTGRVSSVEVAKASRDEFREPAIHAVREWTFEPAKLKGQAVRARVSIPLSFSVEG